MRLHWTEHPTEVFDADSDYTQDDYWDAMFCTKAECEETINLFGFHKPHEYVYILDEIEEANNPNDWYTYIPDSVQEKAMREGVFTDPYYDRRANVWEHDQCATLITALRYWVAYAYEELQESEYSACNSWFATTAPYTAQPFCANIPDGQRWIP